MYNLQTMQQVTLFRQRNDWSTGFCSGPDMRMRSCGFQILRIRSCGQLYPHYASANGMYAGHP